MYSQSTYCVTYAYGEQNKLKLSAVYLEPQEAGLIPWGLHNGKCLALNYVQISSTLLSSLQMDTMQLFCSPVAPHIPLHGVN